MIRRQPEYIAKFHYFLSNCAFGICSCDIFLYVLCHQKSLLPRDVCCVFGFNRTGLMSTENLSALVVIIIIILTRRKCLQNKGCKRVFSRGESTTLIFLLRFRICSRGTRSVLSGREKAKPILHGMVLGLDLPVTANMFLRHAKCARGICINS